MKKRKKRDCSPWTNDHMELSDTCCLGGKSDSFHWVESHQLSPTPEDDPRLPALSRTVLWGL